MAAEPHSLFVRVTGASGAPCELRLVETLAAAFVVAPVPAFYNHPESLQDIIDFVVGKILAVLGIQQDLYPAWGGEDH